MKFVLVNFFDGKVDGIYGGPHEKYAGMYNYIGSHDFRRCGKKFDTIDEAVEVQKHLNRDGDRQFEVICLAEYPDHIPAAEMHFYTAGYVGYTTGEYPSETGEVIAPGTLVGVTGIGMNGYSIQTVGKKKVLEAVGIGWRL